MVYQDLESLTIVAYRIEKSNLGMIVSPRTHVHTYTYLIKIHLQRDNQTSIDIFEREWQCLIVVKKETEALDRRRDSLGDLAIPTSARRSLLWKQQPFGLIRHSPEVAVKQACVFRNILEPEWPVTEEYPMEKHQAVSRRRPHIDGCGYWLHQPTLMRGL